MKFFPPTRVALQQMHESTQNALLAQKKRPSKSRARCRKVRKWQDEANYFDHECPVQFPATVDSQICSTEYVVRSDMELDRARRRHLQLGQQATGNTVEFAYNDFGYIVTSPVAVVLDLFHICYLFFKQDDYQIYSQYTQWCLFIKNTKLTTSYSLGLFIKIYIGCNLWFSIFSTLEDEIYPQG